MTPRISPFIKTSVRRLETTGIGRRLMRLASNSYSIGKSASLALSDRLRFPRTNSGTFPNPPGAYTDDFFARHLRDHLLSFWAKHGVDREYGGFLTHLNRRGALYDDHHKLASMQARSIASFAFGHELFPGDGFDDVAAQGLDFMARNIWDHEFGGWFESVSRAGKPLSHAKPSFDQAYAIYGLAVCGRRLPSTSAIDLARQTIDLVDRHAWDADFGGYVESCRRDWSVQSTAKTICIQLDMLLALMALYEATQQARYLSRATQLADAILRNIIDPRYGCLRERFQRQWTYIPARTFDVTWIGHNVKGAWLLSKLFELTGHSEYLAAAQRILGFSLQHGWDKRHGGLFQYLFCNGRLADAQKLWWTQAEGLQALALCHRLTGEPFYLDYFLQLTEFTFRHFVDWEYGEWFTSCHADGSVSDDRKGYDFKSAYHPVQACYELYFERRSGRSTPPSLIRS